MRARSFARVNGAWPSDGVEGGLRRAGAEAPGPAMVLGASAGAAAAPRRGCRGGSGWVGSASLRCGSESQVV